MAAVALTCLAAGCSTAGTGAPASASNPATSPTSTATTPAPVTGKSLAELGIQHGPELLLLPGDTVVERVVDQQNVVTVFFRTPAPAAALEHFRRAIPAAGMHIDADGGGSLVFSGPSWGGGLTSSDGQTAITLRRNPTR